MGRRKHKDETLVSHLGRNPAAFQGAVNPPVFRASTILYEDLESFEQRHPQKGKVTYGRSGTPTTFALEDTVAALEGGAGSIAVSSGLAAVTLAILALVEAGDHILVADNAYLPTRRFCDGVLKRLGVETSYYDPLIGADIAKLLRPNTRLVFIESPGSLTFEVQDVPAIALAAKAGGAIVVMDNTWATPLFFKPLEHGVDVSIHAGTKYLVGHSDAMLGVIIYSAEYEDQVRLNVQRTGVCAGTEEVYLALRGIRSLAVRMARHQETGLRLAEWLAERPEVSSVLHPALPNNPGYELWRRDFTGASGLFSVVLSKPYPKAALAAMLEGLELFGIGASWGGYESLAITAYPERSRSATRWQAPGPVLRLHAGLEDAGDLISDLELGFERLNEAAAT